MAAVEREAGEALSAAQTAKLPEILADLSWVEHACHTRRELFKDGPAKTVAGALGRLFMAPNAVAWLERKAGQDPALRENWATLKDWTEETRYQSRGRRQAEEILAAINDPLHGVLQWLKGYW